MVHEKVNDHISRGVAHMVEQKYGAAKRAFKGISHNYQTLINFSGPIFLALFQW